MSDMMLLGVLRMPYAQAMRSELSRLSLHSRCQEAADRIEADAATIARLTAELELQTAMLLDAYGDSTVLDQIVKQAVDAETRACAEVILNDCLDDMTRDEEAAAILARLDQRKGAGE